MRCSVCKYVLAGVKSMAYQARHSGRDPLQSSEVSPFAGNTVGEAARQSIAEVTFSRLGAVDSTTTARGAMVAARPATCMSPATARCRSTSATATASPACHAKRRSVHGRATPWTPSASGSRKSGCAYHVTRTRQARKKGGRRKAQAGTEEHRTAAREAADGTGHVRRVAPRGAGRLRPKITPEYRADVRTALPALDRQHLCHRCQRPAFAYRPESAGRVTQSPLLPSWCAPGWQHCSHEASPEKTRRGKIPELPDTGYEAYDLGPEKAPALPEAA